MFGCDINKSISSDKAFQSYSFGWNKDLLKFFSIFLFNKWKIWCTLSPRKVSYPKNSWLRPCSWFLSNMFKSLVICFVYLTNHLTNIRTNLHAFCISPVQSQRKNIKTTLHNCSSVTVLFCIAETERVQSLMKTLARTNFKSI